MSFLPIAHVLKLRTDYFNAVADGSKPFEVRKTDRHFEVGQYLQLDEVQHDGWYTGRCLYVRVTYVLVDFEGLKDGYAVLGITTSFNTETDS